MKKILSALVLSLIFFSCGQKDKKEDVSSEKEITESIDMIVEYKYDKDDVFKVYYNTVTNTPMDGSLLLTNEVHPSSEFQTTTFSFPVGVCPKGIRLDVGNKQDAESITIKSIKIVQGDNVIDFSNWIDTINWSPNECLVYDKDAKVYKIVASNGLKSPVFMSNVIINEKLAKWFDNK